MNATVDAKIKKSSERLRDIVWPMAGPSLGGGTLQFVESESGELAEILDRKAGIDALQVNSVGMRGIASRIQPADRNWKTHTIRYSIYGQNGIDTEYHKRLRAIHDKEGGYLYPPVTMQAYLDNVTLEPLGIAWIRTAILFEYIEQGCCGDKYDVRNGRADWYIQSNKEDGNMFIVVPWQRFEQSGRPIHYIINE